MEETFRSKIQKFGLLAKWTDERERESKIIQRFYISAWIYDMGNIEEGVRFLRKWTSFCFVCLFFFWGGREGERHNELVVLVDKIQMT